MLTETTICKGCAEGFSCNIEERSCTVADAWDGTYPKFTLRRTVSQALFRRWLGLVALMQTITLSDFEDYPVWLFHSPGAYSVSSFYGIVNNGEVIPVHTPAIWKLRVAP